MNLDLAPFFVEYEALVDQVDAVFQKVAGNFPTEVKCSHGCSDCCYALFDIPLIEALYLNYKFQGLDTAVQHSILIDADKVDRKLSVLKRKAFRDAGAAEHADILVRTAQERIRCPLLDSGNACHLYKFRPITCRVYGIPLEIGGKAHTCGLSDFVPNQPYPTVKVERIQDRLLQLSNEVLSAIGSTYADYRLMYVPVSTVLMTVYSEDFFGLNASSGTTAQYGEDHA